MNDNENTEEREIEMINDNDKNEEYEQGTVLENLEEEQFSVLGGRGVLICIERTHSLFSSFPRKHTFSIIIVVNQASIPWYIPKKKTL